MSILGVFFWLLSNSEDVWHRLFSVKTDLLLSKNEYNGHNLIELLRVSINCDNNNKMILLTGYFSAMLWSIGTENAWLQLVVDSINQINIFTSLYLILQFPSHLQIYGFGINCLVNHFLSSIDNKTAFHVPLNEEHYYR